MPVAIAIWSLDLVPGKTQVIVPQGDLRISNAALGEILADQNGRTVVKMTYSKLGENSDDEDEGESEDENEESLSSLVLCALTAGKIENAQVNIVLEEGTPYRLEVVGKNPVSLSGNYIDQGGPDQPPFGEFDSDSEEEEDAFHLRDVSSDVEMDPTELDGIDSDENRFEEVQDEAEAPKPAKRPRETDEKEEKLTKAEKKKNKKLKKENGEAVPVGKEETKAKSAEEKAEKKQGKKQEKKEGKANKEEKQFKELKGGLKVKDDTTGTGPQAKKGDKLQMRYVGKLQNGKVFDKNVKGKPFAFTLGNDDVIKGWDEGLMGMQVGGERTLVIPPQLAYGKRGSKPEIPPNATLTFEVKLVGIN